MEASAEISMYPLNEDYKPAIKAFIARLKQYNDLTVNTNTLSTQVFGDYDTLMNLLTTEMKRSFDEHGKAIFVFKLLKGNLAPDTE